MLQGMSFAFAGSDGTWNAMCEMNVVSNITKPNHTPHPREFKFWGFMKHEVLGVFWVHMAHDWSVYWKILTFAGKNLEISNISVINVCLKFLPKMTKIRLKTKNLQQFCYYSSIYFNKVFNKINYNSILNTIIDMRILRLNIQIQGIQ